MNLANEVEWLFDVIKDHPSWSIGAGIAVLIWAAVGGENPIVNRLFNDWRDEEQRKLKGKREKEEQERLDKERVWITEKDYEAIYNFENKNKIPYPKYTETLGFRFKRNLLTGKVQIARKRINDYEKKSGMQIKE